jgi:hypothetical protein
MSFICTHKTSAAVKLSCNYVRFESVMAVIVKGTILWDITPYSLREGYPVHERSCKVDSLDYNSRLRNI